MSNTYGFTNTEEELIEVQDVQVGRCGHLVGEFLHNGENFGR